MAEEEKEKQLVRARESVVRVRSPTLFLGGRNDFQKEQITRTDSDHYSPDPAPRLRALEGSLKV